LINSSKKLFEQIFNQSPTATSFAPGRVNLIGDHTDYNFGLVMPTPLSLGIEVSITPTNNLLIEGKTQLFKESVRSINAPVDGSWLDFVTGSINVFYEEFPNSSKILKKGVKLTITSNLPANSGVSSSAALEISLLRAINKIENQDLNNYKLAKLAQKIEHNFIGTMCGLMDQMVISSGIAKKAMFFDTKNGNIENVSLFKNHKFLIIHSGSSRTLSKSLYNLRCQECHDASKKLNIQNLSEANRDMVDSLEGISFKRASHVISENKRVEICLNALKNNDPKTFGQKMYESHLSLSHNYEVSSELLDNIIEKSQSMNILGGRLTGAGFGGCCIFLINQNDTEQIFDTLSSHFSDIKFVDVI
tara:strand:- start:398 stop:1480 length:1083 start_codon:yes stop_codon:yes gene_type:complete